MYTYQNVKYTLKIQSLIDGQSLIHGTGFVPSLVFSLFFSLVVLPFVMKLARVMSALAHVFFSFAQLCCVECSGQ